MPSGSCSTTTPGSIPTTPTVADVRWQTFPSPSPTWRTIRSARSRASCAVRRLRQGHHPVQRIPVGGLSCAGASSAARSRRASPTRSIARSASRRARRPATCRAGAARDRAVILHRGHCGAGAQQGNPESMITDHRELRAAFFARVPGLVGARAKSLAALARDTRTACPGRASGSERRSRDPGAMRRAVRRPLKRSTLNRAATAACSRAPRPRPGLLKLRPCDLGVHPRAETAVGAGDHVLPADHAGEILDAVRHHLGMLDHIGGVAHHPGSSILPSGSLTVFHTFHSCSCRTLPASNE